MWENVYSYDIVFRQLMEFNLVRSWVVTYNQMWNLSMREPLTNKSAKNFSGGGSGGGENHSQVPRGKKKSDYCWSFNKGIKCKWAKNCKFIECCKYCDSSAHGVNVCPKLDRKSDSANTSKKWTEGAGDDSKGAN